MAEDTRRCGEISLREIERGTARWPCEKEYGHEGFHRANGERWIEVIDYDEEETLP